MELDIKSEYTLKDVERAINNTSNKEIELVYLLPNDNHIIVKHTLK